MVRNGVIIGAIYITHGSEVLRNISGPRVKVQVKGQKSGTEQIRNPSVSETQVDVRKKGLGLLEKKS